MNWLAALFLPLALTACPMQTQENNNGFDSASWKAQRGANPADNSRGQMLTAVEKRLQPGMDRSEVTALLGEPDLQDAASGSDIYELGRAEFGIDEEYLELQYAEGKLQSHRFMRR